MDLSTISTVPRKKARLFKGRTIIKTPAATDYDGNRADDGIRRTVAAHPPPARTRRRIESNDDGSDSSRFSRGGCSTDGSSGETHNNGGRRGKTEEEKRLQVKDKLAEDQRRKDASRSSEGVIDADDGGGPICFDGVRIDGYNDPTKERYVNHVVQELGGGRPGGNAKYDEDRDCDARAGEGGKKNYRGRKHEESAMTRPSSSSLLSPSKKGGQRMLVGRERVRDRGKSRGEGCRLTYEGSPLEFPSSAVACGEDPLDLARSLQEADRRPTSSSAFHDIVRTTPQKVKHYVTQTMSNVMDSVLQLGGGSMATRRDKLADDASGRRRNPSMEEKRKSTADAALERRTANKPSGHPLPTREKRKSTHQLESREGRHAPTKRNERCGAIAVDDSIDQSTGEDGQDDDNIGMTLAASGQWLNTDDISKNMTPPTNFGVKRCPRGNDSVTKNTSKMNNNRRINDIHSHLRGTKRGDDIESIHSMEDLQIRENKSTTHPSDRRISKKAVYDQRRTKKTYGLATQITRHGMRVDSEEEEWIDSSTKRNSQKARPHRRKKSPSSLPQVTDYTVKRNTRSSLKAYAADGGVITIDSSSDEGDDTSLGASNCASNNTPNDAPEEIVAERRASLRQRRAVGDVASIDAVRIAIGKLIVKSKCVLSCQFGTKSPYIQFSFEDKGKMSEHRAYLSGEELKEVKYQIADDNGISESDEIGETMTVIAFRITPTDQNNLNKFTNSYDQEESDQITGKQYISVEVRDTDDFRAMLEQMRQHPDLGIWCTKESEMEFYDRAKYMKALLDDSRKDRTERMRVARRTRSGGNKKRNNADNKLILVYPFDAKETELSAAASGLKELGGDLLGLDRAHARSVQGQLDEANTTERMKKPSRTHYVTIRDDDKERLCPGQFLNDTLVDFWMRWISRGESQQQSSNVHFFTSHFMTTLKEKGPEAIASWTEKKNINLFQKKLVFIPVNADLHWSLCVVVNPGLIANNLDSDLDPTKEHAFILFFDSLKMHSKNAYARHIRKWLNYEWKRLGRVNPPFDADSLPLVSPKIPYQDNGCDCGVFVCRYAYNLYMMRHLQYTWDDYNESPQFSTLITNGPAFQFCMSDIDRIRREISTLISKLSELYLPMLQKQEEAAKEAKRRAKQKASSNNVNGDADMSTNKDEGHVDEDSARASVEKEDNGEVTMSSFEEKENISQEVGSQNSSYEGVAAPEKVLAAFNESYSDDPMEEYNDYSMEKDKIVSDVI